MRVTSRRLARLVTRWLVWLTSPSNGYGQLLHATSSMQAITNDKYECWCKSKCNQAYRNNRTCRRSRCRLHRISCCFVAYMDALHTILYGVSANRELTWEHSCGSLESSYTSPLQKAHAIALMSTDVSYAAKFVDRPLTSRLRATYNKNDTIRRSLCNQSSCLRLTLMKRHRVHFWG